MKTLKDLAAFTCLTFLACILYAVMGHVSGWCVLVDQTLAAMPDAAQSIKEAAETSNLASTQTLDLIGSATKLVDHSTRAVDSLPPQILTTLAHVQQTTEATTALLDTTRATVAHADAEIDRISHSATAALDSIPPMASEGRRTLTNTADLIGDPALRATIGNVERITNSTALATDDTQKKLHEYFYPPPATSKWVRFYKGLEGAKSFLELGYYGRNALQ